MTTQDNTATKPDYPSFSPESFKHIPIAGEDLLACMGLNSCAGQDRYGKDGAPGFSPNSCAGQGYCATTQMHSCHTNSNCAGQGGCGLYGSESEVSQPGRNDCRSMGSCATPINAGRFITTGGLRGTSVWARAQSVRRGAGNSSQTNWTATRCICTRADR